MRSKLDRPHAKACLGTVVQWTERSRFNAEPSEFERSFMKPAPANEMPFQ